MPDDELRADVARARDDARLVAGVQRGDATAFEAMFRAYWEPLYHFAFRYLHSTDEAEEAVQTVFGRIWRAHAEWRVAGALQNYLYLAVRNACHDRLARDAVARRWRERRVEEIRTESPEGEARPADIDALLNVAELDAAVERALAELPAKRREICMLRLTHDLSYAQIAERLAISPKTVETQLARGLKYLRERLRDHRSTPTDW